MSLANVDEWLSLVSLVVFVRYDVMAKSRSAVSAQDGGDLEQSVYTARLLMMKRQQVPRSTLHLFKCLISLSHHKLDVSSTCKTE
jgi:hypothetical protein